MSIFSFNSFKDTLIFSKTPLENKEKIEDVFAVRALPFSGEQGGQNEGGAPQKSLTQRKSDKTQSNNDQPRTGLTKTNRSAK